MAIKEETMYFMQCDNCGCIWDNGDYISLYSTKEDTLNGGRDDEFAFDGDKHYCPKCYTYDDDDNLIIKNKKQ